jgi:hypothetical protein
MTSEHEASRTLVKSPPELWAECSVAESLARHLGEFGDIQITRVEPETSVAWEGSHASGTVRLEPSGWGTKVILTAQLATVNDSPVEALSPSEETVAVAAAVDEPATAEEPVPVEEPLAVVEPVAVVKPAPVEEPVAVAPGAVIAPPVAVPARRGRSGGLFGRILIALGFKRAPAHVPMPQPLAVAAPEPVVVRELVPVAVPVAVDAPEPVAVVEPDPEPVTDLEPPPELDPDSILAAALDSLGQAHHRPFSRA